METGGVLERLFDGSRKCDPESIFTPEIGRTEGSGRGRRPIVGRGFDRSLAATVPDLERPSGLTAGGNGVMP